MQIGPQLLAGDERLLLGLVTGPAQAEDLGAMHAAAPVETADGIGLAPPFHGLGPLLRLVVLRQPLEGAHEFAVDDPRGERVELASNHGHPRFIQQVQTLLDLTLEDETAGLRYPADGGSSGITARTDVDRLPGSLPTRRSRRRSTSVRTSEPRPPRHEPAWRPQDRGGARPVSASHERAP